VPTSAAAVTTVSLEASTTEPVQGAKTAPLALLGFSDFQCPFCAQFARRVLPEVKRQFIDTGHVQYMLRHYPLESIHQGAAAASVAVECAGRQNRYWDMHDRLFANPQHLANSDLARYAGTLQLDTAAFHSCMGTMPQKINQDQLEAQRLGVESTPTFFLGKVLANGRISISKRINGAVPYPVFQSTIAALLKE